MKLFKYGKDGGPDSTVWGFWLIEWKRLFSVALLCFEDGTREAYHEHAFNSISWVLTGKLHERFYSTIAAKEGGNRFYFPSIRPILTHRTDFHKVSSVGRTWVVTFRGPWKDTWREFLPKEDRLRTLTHGRREVSS